MTQQCRSVLDPHSGIEFASAQACMSCTSVLCRCTYAKCFHCGLVLLVFSTQVHDTTVNPANHKTVSHRMCQHMCKQGCLYWCFHMLQWCSSLLVGVDTGFWVRFKFSTLYVSHEMTPNFSQRFGKVVAHALVIMLVYCGGINTPAENGSSAG